MRRVTLTLRGRLVLVTALLCAAALVAANATGLVLLRTYLMDRVDSQLTTGGGASQGEGAQQGQLSAEGLAKEARESLAGGGDELFARRFSGGSRIYLLNAAGRELVRVPGDGEGPELPGAGVLSAHLGEPFTVGGANEDGGDWRLYVRRTSDDGLLVTAVSLVEVEETLRRLLLIDAAVLSVVLLLLGLGAAWMIRLGLRPLTRMEATAGQITAGDLARRVPRPDPRTEPGRLGLAMNAMLDRVESEITARRHSERRLRRFLSDASHELRTPLTSIRGFAELSRRGGDAAEALARIEAEARRMGVLVEDLLLLARLDEQPCLERRPVDLLELAADLVRATHVQAPDHFISLTGRDGATAGAAAGAPLEPVTVPGDALRLRQVLSNLLSNAVRHTPPGTRVTVGVGRNAAGDAVVEVRDTGPGIAPEHAPRVFDRLYRADPGRGGGQGGAGLGLSIAAALTAAHGGRVELDTAVGEGSTFRVILPRRAPATASAAPRRPPR